MNHHIAVQCNSETGSGPFDAHAAVGGWTFTAVSHHCNLGLRPDEVLEIATIEHLRISDHHHVVQRKGVVVPLVDGRADLSRCEVEVPQLRRDRMRRNIDRVDRAEMLGHIRRDTQVPEPTRLMAAAAHRSFDPRVGLRKALKPTRDVEHHCGPLC